MAIDHLSVYPNGFVIHVVLLLDPHRQHDFRSMIRPGPGGPGRHLRIGVRFANGQTGGQRVGGGRLDVPKDDAGLPTEPYVGGGGGGGGGSGWRFSTWVYPLPPDGPMEVFVSLPAAGLDEGSVRLDGSAIRAAAEQAQVIWT